MLPPAHTVPSRPLQFVLDNSPVISTFKFSCAARNKSPERSGGPSEDYAAAAATPVRRTRGVQTG